MPFSRRCAPVLILLLLLCVTSRAQQAFPEVLRVDEERLQLHILPHGELELPLINTSGKLLKGRLLLEFANFDGNVEFQVTEDIQSAPGSSVQKIALASRGLSGHSPSDLSWLLLRYTITPEAGQNYAPVHGIVQAGIVIKDSFQLRVAGPTLVGFGSKYPATIWVVDPSSGEPRAHVPVTITFGARNCVDMGIHGHTREVVTDGTGYAQARFDLPADASSTCAGVSARIALGDFHEEQTLGFRISVTGRARLTLTTDKPIYQPGQTVHMRALAFKTGKQVRQQAKITFKITDDRGGEQFQSVIATSKFGVAAADWEMPQKAGLGNYRISATIEPEDPKPLFLNSPSYEGTQAWADIRVSRYDLPTFRVEATPDRSYYLPGQDASITVRARYLTGQPVLQANVTIKGYPHNETGEFDSQGRFIQQFDLTTSHFSGPNGRYQDITKALYVTDESTGRTEEGSVTLRLSSQPIHLYLLLAPAPYRALSDDGGPLQFYVTSSYADGTPASVDGSIEAQHPNPSGAFDQQAGPADRTRLATFHTNQYGIARVVLDAIPENLTISAPEPSRRPYWSPCGGLGGVFYSYPQKSYALPRIAQLLLQASDQKGQPGNQTERIGVPATREYLRVRADHALYHPGDAIRVSLSSNAGVQEAAISVSAEDRVIVSQTVQFHDGQANSIVNYDPAFRGKLRIRAFAMNFAMNKNRDPYVDWDTPLAGGTEVLFPARQELQVGIQMQHTTFFPGETATADVSVLRPDGQSSESDLGVLIFDRAVTERARDLDRFHRPSGYSIFDYFNYSYRTSVAEASYRDLLSLDAGKPFPEGMDLVAEAILRSGAGNSYFPSPEGMVKSGFDDDWMTSRKLGQPYPHLEPFYRPMQPVVNVLYDVFTSTGQYPTTEEELVAELKESGLDLNAIRDVWGDRYRPVFSHTDALDVLELVSNGPDKQPDTIDDFVTLNMSWPRFRAVGKAIDDAATEHHARTGGYIRDYATLRTELHKKSIDLDALRDPWGSPYRVSFGVSRTLYLIKVDSPGPNKKFEEATAPHRDDVHAWTFSQRYFQQEIEELKRALLDLFNRTRHFPQNRRELQPALEAAKLTPERLLDPWGHPYSFSFYTQTEYGDGSRVHPRPGGKTNQITAETQNAAYIAVDSQGPAPQKGFTLAKFRRVIAKQSSQDDKPVPTPLEPLQLIPQEQYYAANPYDEAVPKATEVPFASEDELLPSNTKGGAISGTVAWASYETIIGVVAEASVTAISSDAKRHYNVTTGRNGSYLISNLPPGKYRVDVAQFSYGRTVIDEVSVTAGGIAFVDVTLEWGGGYNRISFPQTDGQQRTSQGITGIAGFVKGRTGETVSGATVTITGAPKGSEAWPEPTTMTDAAGSFTFLNLSPGAYALEISANRFMSQVITDIPVLAGKTAIVTAGLLMQEPVRVAFPSLASRQPIVTPGGAITGTVTGPSGGGDRLIFAASVSAISEDTSQRFRTTTDSFGRYSLSNLPPGTYRVGIVAGSYERRIVTQIPVRKGTATVVDANLKSGSCSGVAVDVTGATIGMIEGNDETASMGQVLSENMVKEIPLYPDKSEPLDEPVPLEERVPAEKPQFTPRVRKYFPETLIWRPEVLTDKNGHAHISFPMADSITAWKMLVFASNQDTQVGLAERDLRTFQTFFAETHPPQTLTLGDHISLPVLFRNYSKQKQVFRAELKPGDWFSFTSSRTQDVTIAPGRNATAFFGFRADHIIRQGKLEVTARNKATGDAEEHEVLVHPDGKENSFSSAAVLTDNDSSLEIPLPGNLIPGSNDTELRIYPNLFAHALDGVTALGKPPCGCFYPLGSKGYVSLLTLEVLRKAGNDRDGEGNPWAELSNTSKAALQSEYDALVRAQNADGGFTGWKDSSSVAVTAYVLRFLGGAQHFLSVDPSVMSRAASYLAAQQTSSGAWLTDSIWSTPDVEDKNLTALVTRALAIALSSHPGTRLAYVDPSFQRAMGYLESQIDSWSDAYLVSNYAIAAATAGRKDYIERARWYLDSLAHTEGATSYWTLEANTSPLSGWGTPGRLMTTALSVQALSLLQTNAPDDKGAAQIQRGLQYLLRHKDARAGWHSALATQSVIEAIIAAMPPLAPVPEQPSSTSAQVVVNGHPVASIDLPPSSAVVGPVTVELADHLQKGPNQIQIAQPGNPSALNLTALSSYYIPWSDSTSTGEESGDKGDTRTLRLKVHFDRTQAGVGKEVHCKVEAQQIGFKGYGALVAEIGLPPGAEVDPASVGGWGNIQPGRVVFSIYPRAEGTQFEFTFRVRYPEDALTAPSVLYDYDNPESRVTVKPVRFTVH